MRPINYSRGLGTQPNKHLGGGLGPNFKDPKNKLAKLGAAMASYLKLSLTHSMTGDAIESKKHRKNCECCHHHSVFKGHNVIVHILVLNCQKCNQRLKSQISGHKNFQKI